VTDHHSAYLAQTLEALTPEGRARVDELLEPLTAGFMVIRDQEPLEDVAQWANAMLALLADMGGPHS
jgi:hypothetical protein